jgi:hypothetical protein
VLLLLITLSFSSQLGLAYFWWFAAVAGMDVIWRLLLNGEEAIIGL